MVRERDQQPVHGLLAGSGFMPAVAVAWDRTGLAHPGDFTHKIVFRRCPACGQLNIVRDGSFAFAVCDSTLPDRWNISRT